MGKALNVNFAVIGTIGLGILIWIVILWLREIPAPYSFDALKEIPTAAGWASPILYWFTKRGWRSRLFRRWLVLLPDLNGTWEGELQTNWKDPKTGQSPGPIPGFIVIRQSLFRITCALMTKESKSWSRAATIQLAPDGLLKILEFTYSNSPRVSVQNRSTAHEGACSLEIIGGNPKRLRGKYWTERNTKGEMDFKFSSAKLREAFDIP